MLTNVSTLCKSALLSLWKISMIRTILDQCTNLQLIHAFNPSRMDYYNSLRLGLPSREIRKIGNTQNSVVHIVSEIRKYDHATSIKQELHWLTVHQCVKLKVNSTTYMIIYGASPTYFSDLLSNYTPPRNFHINSAKELSRVIQ